MTTEQLYQLFLLHPVVETDSRNISKGCMFFALKGEKFNGNRFAAEALEKGAAYAVIDEEEYLLNDKTILVGNVLQSLQALASHHRRQLAVPVLGITGSNGKTTTKELIAAVLSAKYRIVSTRGNLNNHIGVPLTLLQMRADTQMGVIEMGANHAGEIAELSAIADPDYGIITNIGIAHLEGFGSFEVIKDTKAGLYRHVQNKKGTIFFNSGNPVLADLAAKVDNKISFGEKDADFTGEPVSASPFVSARLKFPDLTREVSSHLIGSYNFENLLAAACIGNYFDVDPDEIQKALCNYQPQNNRSQLIEKANLKIVMDAYNANPTSMKASINSFISSFPFSRVLILGDMLELGVSSREEHTSILELISKNSFDEVFLVGPVFKDVAAKYSFRAFTDYRELIAHLQQQPLRKGAVLIKGSRGIQLEKVVEYI